VDQAACHGRLSVSLQLQNNAVAVDQPGSRDIERNRFMARNLGQEPPLPTMILQGDILPGLIKKHERLIFFGIKDVGAFKTFLDGLQITSMDDALQQRRTIDEVKKDRPQAVLPAPGLNIAFTFSGLQKLGVPKIDTIPADAAFRLGMAARQAKLADPDSTGWNEKLRPDPERHGVFVLTGGSEAEILDTIMTRLAPAGLNGFEVLHSETGKVRPHPVEGHEHFGFADGVSQPGVRGRIDANTPYTQSQPGNDDQGMPGQDLLWPGEFVFGLPGQNPGAATFTVKGDIKKPPIPFMQSGAYLVFRRLKQLVPEFHIAVREASSGIGGGAEASPPDLLAAQLVGRWKSGAPLINAPTHDDVRFAEGSGQENNFEFAGDREGLVCPWAAHVRKAYPRDDVLGNLAPSDGDKDKAEAVTQSHRMMRRGIAFGPEVTEDEALSGTTSGERGLIFKCYVTSIEDQFEFVQQVWVDNPDFVQPGSGFDPIIGQPAGVGKAFLGASPKLKDAARKPQIDFEGFVHMEGGEYFFSPSLDAIRSL